MKAKKPKKTNKKRIQIWQLFKLVQLFPSLLNFSQQQKKLSRVHDILSYIFSFILAKTKKSIRNDF